MDFPNVTWDISIGNLLLGLFIVGATCKSLRQIEDFIDRKISALHEGQMVMEETRIRAGQRTTLRRIIDYVIGQSGH